jgi:hypothetical protein
VDIEENFQKAEEVSLEAVLQVELGVEVGTQEFLREFGQYHSGRSPFELYRSPVDAGLPGFQNLGYPNHYLLGGLMNSLAGV